MLTREYDQRDGRKVWLSEDELHTLVEQPETAERRVAFGLAGYCGLRSHEVLQIKPEHIHDTAAGRMLSVPEGKGEKYRETPIPATLAKQIETIGDYSTGWDSPVVTVANTRTLRKWITKARAELRDATDEDRWRHVSLHDLRSTWANQLSQKDVDSKALMQWGGWNDLDTFLEHYEGAYSPEAQKREREKVDWL